MSEHWTPKALSALARYANGFAFKPHHWTKEGLPIVRIEQLNNPEGEYDFFLGYVPPDNLIDDGDLSSFLGALRSKLPYGVTEKLLSINTFSRLSPPLTLTKNFCFSCSTITWMPLQEGRTARQ
jgi:hypothetical protein